MFRTVKTPLGAIDYELIQTQRHSMEIRLQAEGNVRLFAPRRAPLRAADDFIVERAQWIAHNRAALRAHHAQRQKLHPMVTGATVLYEGEPLEIVVRQSGRNGVRFEGDGLMVCATDTAEEAVREQLHRFLTEQARARIAARLAHFVPLIGREPGRFAIRDQRTRWGSCSSERNLNFNYKLIMAPPPALDYVVVHELCHLYEFNHSPLFWRRVEQFFPDYKTWKDWLKKNGRMLGV